MNRFGELERRFAHRDVLHAGRAAENGQLDLLVVLSRHDQDQAELLDEHCTARGVRRGEGRAGSDARCVSFDRKGRVQPRHLTLA